jgi:hypothetical protein
VPSGQVTAVSSMCQTAALSLALAAWEAVITSASTATLRPSRGPDREARLGAWRHVQQCHRTLIARVGSGHDFERHPGIGDGAAHWRYHAIRRAVGAAETEWRGEGAGRGFQPDDTAMRAEMAFVGAGEFEDCLRRDVARSGVPVTFHLPESGAGCRRCMPRPTSSSSCHPTTEKPGDSSSTRPWPVASRAVVSDAMGCGPDLIEAGCTGAVLP